ncbi:MAG TPA: DNA repair exonuclease [bacterium]|nr:DNA repair exonuclease [bacterium]
MSLRLLHTSDVHLGATFKVLGDRGAEQRKQLRETFARVIDLALAERVDAMLIAGDLFDSVAASRVHAAFAADQLARLGQAGIPVCAIAGNHDPLGEGSAGVWAELERRCPGLTVFGQQLGGRVIADRDLTIVGRSAPRRLSADSPLAGLPVRRETRYQVAVAHGSVERPDFEARFTMITPREIGASQVDYLALGDWHSAQDVSAGGVTAYYSGAPELIDADEAQAGHVLLVTIPAPGRAEVEPRRVGRRRSGRLAVDLATAGDGEAIARRIRAQADPDLALRVVLTGLGGPDSRVLAARLCDELAASFFRLDVRDESQLRPEVVDPSQYPDHTVIGRFVGDMWEQIAARQGDDRALAEEALAYGIALLQGTMELPPGGGQAA